jgi:hypothetical protein
VETTLHQEDKNDEKNKKGMNRKGDQRGIVLSESPFNYAVSYWLKHAMEVRHGTVKTSLSRELWDLVRSVFWDQDGEIFTEWVRVFASGDEGWHNSSSLSKPLRNTLGKSHITRSSVAASYGLVDIFEWAHPDGVNFDVPDKWGYTPLIWAAGAGEADVVRILLSKYSVRINQTSCLTPTTEQCSDGKCKGIGYSALMGAARLVDLAAMKLLLEQPGIEVDLASHGRTALGLAISDQNQKAVELLVGAGAKLAMNDGHVIPSYL